MEETTQVELDIFELGFLTAFVLEQRHRDSSTAQSLYYKFKNAAIALGVDWYYGDPPEWTEK